MNKNNLAIVKATQLSKYFGNFCAVDQISFEVFAGECLGILGPNGAGKTTTLKMLLGHCQLSAGQLQVLGFNIPEQARQLRAYLGVVPQVDYLDMDFTVIENLYSYASFFSIKPIEVSARMNELLQFTELTEKRNAPVATLSGGMKRRLSLARALIHQPKILILDEPTTGLDPQARQMIWARVRQLKSQGTSLILTTHYMEEAERLCDRIVVIDHGKLLAEGTPRDLINQHIESNVIEIQLDTRESWQENYQHLSFDRVELVGETLFGYTNQESTILAELSNHAELCYSHRRANLEDVFLKLTGRELRDA